MIEEMQKHEANVKRLKVLKELELMSKPPKGPQKVDKKKEIIKKLKWKAEKIQKSRSESVNELSANSNDSGFKFNGKYEFVMNGPNSDKSASMNTKDNKAGPKAFNINKGKDNIVDLIGKKSIKNKRDLSLKITESYEDSNERPIEKISIYSDSYGNERFEDEEKSNSFCWHL